MAELGTPRGVLPPIIPTTTPAGYTPPSGTGAVQNFSGFPNFPVPFPYQNMPQQLLASMQNKTPGTYQRFGAATTTPAASTGLLNFPMQTPAPAPSGGGLLNPPGGAGPSSVPSGVGGGMTPNMQSQLSALRAYEAARGYTQPTTPQFNQGLFNGLNDAQKFVYLNSLPRGSYDGNASVQPFMGANWNNIDYNGLINGIGANQLKWDFTNNQIRGPQGLLSNPTLSYTYGG